jgi:hypothetical protein
MRAGALGKVVGETTGRNAPSTPTAASLRTTSATAVRSVAERVSSLASLARARISGGRIRLPAKVVRRRSVLRFTGCQHKRRVLTRENRVRTTMVRPWAR